MPSFLLPIDNTEARTVGALNEPVNLWQGPPTIGLVELQDINLAFELLKGERKSVNLGPMEVDPKKRRIKSMIGKPMEFFCTTNWELALGGRRLGTIPVLIHLPRFQANEIPGSRKLSITKGVDGEAWMTYSEHHDIGVYMARQRA